METSPGVAANDGCCLARLQPSAQAVGEVVAGGALVGARSYDSVTRTVIPLP